MSLQQREAIAALIAQKQAQESPKQTSAPGLRSFDASAQAPTGTPTVQTDFGNVMPAPAPVELAPEPAQEPTPSWKELLPKTETSNPRTELKVPTLPYDTYTSRKPAWNADEAVAQVEEAIKQGVHPSGSKPGIFHPMQSLQEVARETLREMTPEDIFRHRVETFLDKRNSESVREKAREKLEADWDTPEYKAVRESIHGSTKIVDEAIKEWQAEYKKREPGWRAQSTENARSATARGNAWTDQNRLMSGFSETAYVGRAIAETGHHYKPQEQSDFDAARYFLDHARYYQNTYSELENAIHAQPSKEMGFTEKAYRYTTWPGLANALFTKDKSGKSRFDQFLHGIAPRNVEDAVSFGWAETVHLSRLNSINAKAARGEELTDGEKAMAGAYLVSLDAQAGLQMFGGATTAEKFGQFIGENVPFLIEMGLTGGLGGAAGGAVRGLMRKGIVAGIKTAAKSGVKKTISTALKNGAVRYGAKQGANIVGSLTGGMATAPFSQITYRNYAQRTNDQYDVGLDAEGNYTARLARPTSEWERGWKSYVGAGVELGSEFWGTFAGAGRIFPRWMQKTKVGEMLEPIRKFTQTPGGRRFDNYVGDVFKWNGGTMEGLEEEFSNALEPILTGETERLKENFSPEAQFDTILGVVAMSTAMGAVRTPIVAFDHARHARTGAKLRSQISDPTLRESLQQIMAAGTRQEQAQKLGQIDWSKASMQDRAAAMDYVAHRVEGRVTQDMQEAMREQAAAAEAQRRFEQHKNRDTGNLETVTDHEGRTFYLAGGTLETGENGMTDGTVFVIDPETGETSQRSVEELKRGETTTPEQYETEFRQQLETISQAEAEAADMKEIIEEANAAGEDPTPRMAEYKGVDLNGLAGQTVTLADGSQAYINQVYTNRNGFVEIDAVPVDPSTGQLLTNENGEEAHTLLDVRSIVTPKQQQQAQTGQNEEQLAATDLRAGQRATLADGREIYVEEQRQPDGSIRLVGVSEDAIGDATLLEIDPSQVVAIDGTSVAEHSNRPTAIQQGTTDTPKEEMKKGEVSDGSTAIVPEPADGLQNGTTPLQNVPQTGESLPANGSEMYLTESHESLPDLLPTQTDNRNSQNKGTNSATEIRDENGHSFVLASDGSTAFGYIAEETGLPPAPIRLSTGEIINNATKQGYGLVHIEARHGEQIRQAGFRSVEDFVETVARNYDQIKEGKKRKDGTGTYLLQVEDAHNNTLYVELSKDGSYWNINSAGVFKKSYARGNKMVYSRHTTANQTAESDEASQTATQRGAIAASRMNAPTTYKATTSVPNVQETGQEIPRKKDGTPDYERIEDPTVVASALHEEFGAEAAEVARESLDEAREALEQADNIRKAIDRRRAQIKAQNEVTKWEEVCDALAPTRETGTTEQTAETQDVPDVTLDPVMGDLITEEMHGRAPGTITVREQSDPKANNNFIQRYDIDGQPSGVYGIYDVEADINTEPVSFGLDEFSFRAENWDELEQMYNEYKASHPNVRSRIDDEGGAQFRDINDALDFKRFVDTQTADPIRNAATPEAKHRAVAQQVTEMNDASGAKAHVVNDVAELPEGLRSQLEEGFERDGITWRRESYICAPQMQDAEQTRRTYIHEVGGHQNVEHAIATAAEKGALWEAIVDDIGLDGLRAWGISELNEEITAYEAGEMAKWQLGREALAYATEMNADLPYFDHQKPLSLTVDLNQRITPETLRAILETANRYDDQRPSITITGNRKAREGGSVRSARVAERGTDVGDIYNRRHTDLSRENQIQTSGTVDHVSAGSEIGQAVAGSNEIGIGTNSRNVSEQNDAGAGRAESGALPAGETVADDIRYRRGGKTGTASDRTLVGVHNISGEYLLKAIRQGGMANPSVAVIDIDRQAYNDFGEISLVMPAALIDKRTGRNAGTWPTDAWTPVYPEVERRFGKGGEARARKDIRSVPRQMQETTRSGIEARMEERPENDRLAYLFLHERGKAPELIYSEGKYPREVRRAVEKAMGDYARFDRLTEAQQKQIVDIYIQTLYAGDRNAYQAEIREKAEKLQQKFRKQTSPRSLVARRAQEKANRLTALGYDYQQVSDWANDVARDVMHEGTFDEQGTVRRAKEYIEQNGLQEDFEQWLDGLDERYQVREVVFDGFTPTGNRRYVPNTLENVSRIMQKKGRNGAAGFGISFQSFAAGLLGEQGELEQIRERKQKLTPNEAEVDAFHERWEEVFFELGEKLQPGANGLEDYGLHRLAEAARKKDPKAFIKREYGIDFTDEDGRRLKEMVDAIRNDYPATYFETKFERPVTLEEVAAAVVPDNADPKIRRALQEAGVAVTTYRAQDKADRKRALDEATAAEEIRFRNREAEMVDRLSPEEINTRFNEALENLGPENAQSAILWLGMPSDALQAAGIRNVPLKLYGNKLLKKIAKHGYQIAAIKSLPQAVANPIFVFDGNRTGSFAVLTELRTAQGNILAVIDVNKNGEADVNMVSSVFGKDDNEILRWIDAGKLRWVDKEKARIYVSAPALNAGATHKTEPVSSATNIIKNFTNPTLREGEKASAAQTLADELGVPVRVVRSADEISGEESRFREKRGATGWHDRATGEIAVVLPNCADAAEVQRTILHEAVGHYGLPQLLGRERADELYRRVFDVQDKQEQEKRLKIRKEEIREDLQKAGRSLTEEQIETLARTIEGDEYLAEMAEGNVTPGVFRRMLAAVRAFFREVLGIDLKLTDADIRYILWRSKHNLQQARTVNEAMEVIEQDIRLRAQTAHESARERKAERIDKLRRSEPLVFSGDEYKGKYELNNRSAASYINNELRGEYINQDTNTPIRITRKGAFKVTRHDAENTVHLQSVAYIPQMLEKAIYIDEAIDEKSKAGFDSYRYYVCGLKIDEVDYTAKLVVGQKNGETYYDHALTQIEKADLIERRDEISSSFTNNEAALSAIKDKRLVSILQAEPLAYQQKAAKNEPKTVMEHLDRLADETTEADETRFRKKREPKSDDPIRTTKGNLATRMGRKLQDAHIPVRQLQDYVRKHGGTTDIDTDVYSALNRAFGRQTERMRRTDEKFRRIEKRVNEIHRKWGFGYKATEEYLAAKSSQERHAAGIAAYAETTQAPWNRLHVEETIARFESVVPKEKIEALWRDIREMTQYQLDVMKNCDLITVQTYRDIQARGWQYYLPLQGLDFEFEDMADPHKLFDDALTTGRGTGAGALLRKARGRTTKPGDVLATLQRNVHLTIMAGEQNLAKLFLLRLAEQNPQLQGDTRTGKTTADDVAAMTATNDRFNEELETLTPENADATILWLGSPSAVLLSAGIEKKPIKLHGNKVFKKMKKHGFALEELRNLPEAVADPIAVFRNKDRKGNRSILTELKTENGNFLVTIDLGKDADIDFNVVSSVFGKADDSVLNWIEQGLATYINKEKALAFLSRHPAPIAGTAASAELSPATNIIKNFTNPTLPETKKRRAGIFEIEEQWFVRREDSRITEAERERGEIYEKTLRRPPQEEIERSEAARREMKQAEQELRAVEKGLRSIDPLDGDNDRLAELQDRRIELERRMDEAFDRITVLRTPPPKHAYTGLSKSEEARFEVPVYRHGVRTVVRLSDANAARAINGDFENLFGGAAQEIVRRIGSATRTMAGLNTSWNPEFMLKNKVRDSVWALFYNWLDKEGSARGYLRNQGAAHAAIYRYHTNGARPLTMNERAGYDLYSTEGRQQAVERYGAERVRDSLYDDFLMEGGLTGYAYMQDLDHYSRKLKKRARRAGNSVMQAFNAAATGFDLLNDLSEVSTRFATFLAQVERGSDVRSAVNYARDVTINFNRRGEWGRDLNALYMFYNASLQGVANLYQLGRRNKTRMGFAMAAVAGLGYGLSFLLNLWLSAMAEEAGDDDEWRVSDYRRFTNICLPGWLVGSTERVVTIPLPQELRPAWVLGTVMADVTQGRLRADEGWGTAAEIFNSVADAAGESFLPVEVDSKHPLKTFVPSVFKPLYEIGVNANFMDRKIYREAYPGQTIPESQLGMRNTFIAYKTVCEWLNEQGGGSTTVPAGMNEKGEINRWLNLLDVNPSKAEHLLSSYAGGAGRLIGRTWRCIAEPGDERRAGDIPFINAFMADVEQEENPNTRYYDTKEKLEMLNEVYRRSERGATNNTGNE